MQQIVKKSSFSILMTSSSIDNSFDCWQEQCQQLYNSICEYLPKDSIKPSSFKGSDEEKADIITVFSTLAAFGITGKVFGSIILDLMKTWLEHRPTAEIELKCPNGSIKITNLSLKICSNDSIKITNLSLTGLSEIFKENPYMSICEVLNFIIISNK